MGRQIKIPSCVYASMGSIEEVGTILERESSKKTPVFIDKRMAGARLLDELTTVLERTGVKYKVFNGPNPGPVYADVEKAVEQMNQEDGDTIIAIGGGNAMDAAKLCSLLEGSSRTMTDLLTDPLLALEQMKTTMIPTTYGVGPEATCNVIVAIPEEQSKKGVVNAEMVPDYVILGAQIIAGLPVSIVVTTGMDALAYVVKRFTSKKAIPSSDMYAAAGAKLIFRDTEEAYGSPGDMEARSNTMLGAFYSGVTITDSSIIAVHALSHPLGEKYHIPHGVLNTILFARAMAFNKNACTSRLRILCDAVYSERAAPGTREKADYMIGRIATIVEDTEIPIHLNAFGVKMAGLNSLVDTGSKQQRLLANNRRKLGLEDIRAIHLKVLKGE